MLVGVSFNNTDYETVTGITYNGTPLQLVGARAAYGGDDARHEIWKLVNPDSGTHNVIINFSSALDFGAVAGVMTFTNVDQTTPLGTYVYIEGTDSAGGTLAVPSDAGELVYAIVSSEDEALTASSGQDEHWNISISGDETNGAGGTDAGASPTAPMSWGVGVAHYWTIGGVSIKPVAVPPPDCSGGGSGVITLDNVTPRYNSGTGDLAHAIGSGSGNNRLLIVGYGQEGDSTIDSLTYNGVAMAKIHRESFLDGAYNVTEMWYMLDDDLPVSAGTYNVSMTVTGGNNPGIVVLSFEGVAQQAPETYNFSTWADQAYHTYTTQLQNVSVGSLVVSLACNGSSLGYDGAVGGAGGAGIRQSEGQPSSAGMGVSTDLSSAGGTFDVVEVSEHSPSVTRRATHIVAAFAPAPTTNSPSLWTLEITLTDPNDNNNSVTMRTKVFVRNIPPS
jgi:hypothetical protein